MRTTVKARIKIMNKPIMAIIMVSLIIHSTLYWEAFPSANKFCKKCLNAKIVKSSMITEFSL